MTDEQNERAFDPVTLQEKLIEPDRTIRRVNRNMQLGYIKIPQLMFMQHRAEHAIMLESIPFEHGGYITSHFADLEWEKIDVFIVASNSVDGFGRRSQRATEMKQTMKDESERGFFNAFRR
jgi:hypothetical protein